MIGAFTATEDSAARISKITRMAYARHECLMRSTNDMKSKTCID